MGSIVDDATTIAGWIAAAGVRATVDPAKAETNRPCVLVAPPTINYSTRANTWPVVLLASKPIGSLAALDELDELLQAVAPVINIEDARPTGYLLTPQIGAVPAYVCTLTT